MLSISLRATCCCWSRLWTTKDARPFEMIVPFGWHGLSMVGFGPMETSNYNKGNGACNDISKNFVLLHHHVWLEQESLIWLSANHSTCWLENATKTFSMWFYQSYCTHNTALLIPGNHCIWWCHCNRNGFSSWPGVDQSKSRHCHGKISQVLHLPSIVKYHNLDQGKHGCQFLPRGPVQSEDDGWRGQKAHPDTLEKLHFPCWYFFFSHMSSDSRPIELDQDDSWFELPSRYCSHTMMSEDDGQISGSYQAEGLCQLYRCFGHKTMLWHRTTWTHNTTAPFC